MGGMLGRIIYRSISPLASHVLPSTSPASRLTLHPSPRLALTRSPLTLCPSPLKAKGLKPPPPPDMTDLKTKPPTKGWLKKSEEAFKKKFLGPDLYKMLPWDPVKIVEYYVNTYLEETHHPNIEDMLKEQGVGLPGIGTQFASDQYSLVLQHHTTAPPHYPTAPLLRAHHPTNASPHY